MFGAVLSIICGFLMAVCRWSHTLQHQSFLRLLKLRKLAVCKLDLSGGGPYLVSQCARPSIKLEYLFNGVKTISCVVQKSGWNTADNC